MISTDALRNPDAYPHSVSQIEIIETHISIVVLTGNFVYKIKKPLNLGFLDFSTLAQRKFFCEEEVRLNQRYASELYLDTVPITGTADAPLFGGPGPALEYAVKMRQFPQDQLLDRMLEHDKLDAHYIDELVAELAAFHLRIRTTNDTIPFELQKSIYEPTLANFHAILSIIDDSATRQQVEAIESRSLSAFTGLETTLAQRAHDGFVRECHGDLHLGNIALINHRVTFFDGIEFSERLRWIDVMSELAFLVMDLEARGQLPMARRALNAYLQHTGDYEGLRVLRYYQCYRAMVRAKVSAIRLNQLAPDCDEYADVSASFHRYLKLADSYAKPSQTWLAITMGLSGSGKTTLTQPLIEQTGAIRIRSDVERKRLFGLAEQASSDSAIGGSIYTSSASAETYQRLAELAGGVLASGFPVVVDATFLRSAQRRQFAELAQYIDVPFVILHFHADDAVLRQRIVARRQHGSDASEATLAVLDRQISTQQPLSETERQFEISVDATDALPLQTIQVHIENRHR